MIGAHPFGTEITPDGLIEQFAAYQQWEERYRALILLARHLPVLDAAEKSAEIELTGCENRVWLGYQRGADGRLHFYGDSEGRIVKGLLAVILTAVEGKTAVQLRQLDPLTLFTTLGLHQQLSATRASGLQALAQRIAAIAQQECVQQEN